MLRMVAVPSYHDHHVKPTVHSPSYCWHPLCHFLELLRLQFVANGLMWTHQSAIRLSTSKMVMLHVMSCWGTFAYTIITKQCQTQSNAVKRCQMLETQKLLAPGKVFCFQMFSDKLINSIQLHSTPFNSIQLHSTPLKHHDTNYSIDPVPPASKGGQDSPESPWKKKNSDVAMETVPVDQWVSKILSGNIPKLWILHGIYHKT